jgi:hypothetical protein
VIVGGLVFGTILTLYVIPAAYTLLTGQSRRVSEEDVEGGVTAVAAAGE